jgi:hypothetical protein
MSFSQQELFVEVGFIRAILYNILRVVKKWQIQEKKWILFDRPYILAGNLWKSRIYTMNNVQA